MDEFRLMAEENSHDQQSPLKEEGRKSIHDQLVDLQEWNLEDGQTIEQRRDAENKIILQEELERNQQLRSYWQEKNDAIHAKKPAKGKPKQVQKEPPKKTAKQRRAEAAKMKKSGLDHTGLRIYESVKEEHTMRDNVGAWMRDNVDGLAREKGVDLRAMRGFSQGYKVDKKGRPIDEEQQRRMEADHTFIMEYITGTDEQRKRHLDHIVDVVLSTDITEDMFTYEYIEDHAAEVHEKSTRLVYMEQIMNEPRNKPYFDALPEAKREYLEHKVKDAYLSYFPQYFEALCQAKGVSADRAMLVQGNKESWAAIYNPNVEYLKGELAKLRPASQKALKQIYQKAYDKAHEKKKKELLEGSDQMKAMVESEKMKTDKQADMTNLNLTGYATGYSFDDLANHRKMIEDSPEKYSEHKPLIDALYQQLYRTMDAVGDFKLELMTTQGMMDDLRMTGDDKYVYGREVLNQAMLRQEEVQTNMSIVERRLNATTDALKGILQDKPLSEPAKEVIKNLGFTL